jgi:hypothetical protein
VLILVNWDKDAGDAVSVAATMARVPVSAMSEKIMNYERRIVFILEDYVKTPFVGLI